MKRGKVMEVSEGRFHIYINLHGGGWMFLPWAIFLLEIYIANSRDVWAAGVLEVIVIYSVIE